MSLHVKYLIFENKKKIANCRIRTCAYLRRVELESTALDRSAKLASGTPKKHGLKIHRSPMRP
jgi:hypothetical protein